MKLATERMQAHVDGNVGWMIFNNPARHNALSLEMWQGIGDILEAFQADDEVRVVVMRGAGGRAFVSGADISEFDKHRSNAAQRASYGETAAKANRALAALDNFDDIEGISTLISPNDNFYRIDSALSIPRIDVDTWSMKITGMVDNELEFTFDDLLAMDPVEEFVESVMKKASIVTTSVSLSLCT